VPPEVVLITVDHAWIKDSPNKGVQKKQRAAIEQLRKLVDGGATIPDAFAQLNQKAEAWHIGNPEEYAYAVVPAEAHDLADGTLSPIIPGDGGLHLFKIYSRRHQLPPADKVREPLYAKLRAGAKIEKLPAEPDKK